MEKITTNIYLTKVTIKDLTLTALPMGVDPSCDNSVLIHFFDNVNMEIPQIDPNSNRKLSHVCYLSLNQRNFDSVKVQVYKHLNECNVNKLVGESSIQVGDMINKISQEYNTSNRKPPPSDVEENLGFRFAPMPLCAITQSSSYEISNKKVFPSDSVKSLCILKNEEGQDVGNMTIIICMTCMGPAMTPCDFTAAKIDDDCCSNKSHKDNYNHTLGVIINNVDDVKHNDPRHRDPGNKYMPLAPPASATHIPAVPCDEFFAEINENSLKIRIPKNLGMVARVCEEDDGHKFDCNDNGYEPKSVQPCLEDYAFNDYQVRRNVGGKFVNICGMPPIKGNLKYPANTEVMVNLMNPKQNKIDVTEKYRKKESTQRHCALQCNPNEIEDAANGIFNGPPGIEVCKKESKSDVDVFILKIDKSSQSSDSSDGIEVEVRTPKSPIATRVCMETRGAQVIESEFESKVEEKKDDTPEKEDEPKKEKGKGKGKKEKGKKGKK